MSRSPSLVVKRGGGNVGKIAKALGLAAACAMAVALQPAQAAGFFAPADSATIDAATERALHEPLDDLTRDVEHMHPVAMFFLAKRLTDAGKMDDALFWFYEGQLRWRAHLAKNKDAFEADVFERLFSDVGPDINRYAGQHIELWLATIDKVLAWDSAHPDELTPAGAEKDQARNGLEGFRSYIVANADEIRQHAAEEARQAALVTPDDPYPGEGGAMFGTPQEMVPPYDPAKFAAFKIGVTTKAEVARVMGKPEMWSTDKDGSSAMSYPHRKAVAGGPILGMSQRVAVTFHFDAKHVLTAIDLPNN